MKRILEPKKIHVNFKKDWGYRCPICRQIILPTDDDGFILHPEEDRLFEVTPCPHLLWCNTDNNADHNQYGDWAFMYVRYDITKKIVQMVRDDSVLKQNLRNYGICISNQEVFEFLCGKYEAESKVSCVFANLPIVYEYLLPPNSSIFKYSYSEYSCIEFAIEGLFSN